MDTHSFFVFRFSFFVFIWSLIRWGQKFSGHFVLFHFSEHIRTALSDWLKRKQITFLDGYIRNSKLSLIVFTFPNQIDRHLYVCRTLLPKPVQLGLVRFASVKFHTFKLNKIVLSSYKECTSNTSGFLRLVSFCSFFFFGVLSPKFFFVICFSLHFPHIVSI